MSELPEILPQAQDVDKILALDFLTAAADLLEDPKTPQSLQDVIIGVLDSHAEIFMKLINN